MHHFSYVGGALHAEGVSLARIAEAVGTPFYCSASATLERHYRVLQQAFAGLDFFLRRCLERAAHAAAGEAECAQPDERSRQPKPQPAVHSSPIFCPLHGPQHLTASETANRFKADTALFSPFRRPFPTALSSLGPFCGRYVAPFPHSWFGS